MPRSFPIRRLVRRQQNYVAIAVAIYAGLWAADRPVDLSSTIIYTLPLSNLIALIQDYLGGFYRKRRGLESWAIYLGLVLAVAIVGVGVVNLIQFPLHGLPAQTLGNSSDQAGSCPSWRR